MRHRAAEGREPKHQKGEEDSPYRLARSGLVGIFGHLIPASRNNCQFEANLARPGPPRM